MIMENKIWILIWYIATFFVSLFAVWLISTASEIYLKHKSEQIKCKRERYRKYGMVYKYNGVLKDVISYD
jgi:hypothetical protein